MADSSTSFPCQQIGNELEGQARVQRQRPKATLMDCILRTPLKSLRRSSHLSLTIVPVTPPTKHEKKRKLRASSSTANENIPVIGGKKANVNARYRSSIARRTYSEPTSVNYTTSRALFPSHEQYEEDELSSQRPSKRSRVDCSADLPPPAFNQDESVIYGMSGEDVEYEMRRLQLHELATRPSMDTDEHAIQICNADVLPDLHRLIRNMKASLDVERSARRKAEENHLIELSKRLEMEKLVEQLQGRVAF